MKHKSGAGIRAFLVPVPAGLVDLASRDRLVPQALPPLDPRTELPGEAGIIDLICQTHSYVQQKAIVLR